MRSTGASPSRRAGSVPWFWQLAQFLLVNLVGYMINQAVFLSSHGLIWSHFLGPAMSWNLAKATASLIALFWNFGANRVWTWRGL